MRFGHRVGRRNSCPISDRGEIEDGALDGRHLEICWLRSATEALFTQIQGSARVRLEDGALLRINYDAHNGYPYMPVGRVLIERNLVPKDEMSMQRIRDGWRRPPEEAKDVRRQNRSFVFFRIVDLATTTRRWAARAFRWWQAARSRSIRPCTSMARRSSSSADLPLAREERHRIPPTVFAQDTGSAIVGPARADLYFGAGDEAAPWQGASASPEHS